MRGLILGIAVVCYAAALAIAGAALRLPARQAPAGQMQTAVEGLAREQAASREIVTQLRATVAQLQQELADRRAAPPADEPQEKTVAVLGGDLLPPGQQTLGPGAADAVRAALPELLADDRRPVSVDGHTDSRPIRAPAGKAFKDNADLSLLRARAVAALLRQHGVPAARIRVAGWGDTRPLATNDTAAGRELNRRVEIRLLPPAAER